MASRGLPKSVHADEQRVLRTLMIKARKQAGLTQFELAQRLRRPQSFVAKYEGGERRLDVIEFVHIARAIGADPLKIMKLLVQQTK